MNTFNTDILTRSTPVTKQEVMKQWAELETDADQIQNKSIPELAQILIDNASKYPIEIFWREEPIHWFKVTLQPQLTKTLRVIQSPPGTGWNKASDITQSVRSVAENIHTESIDLENKEIDIQKIKQIATDKTIQKPVLVGVINDPNKNIMLYDGNHRATAYQLQQLQGTTNKQEFTLYVGCRVGIPERSLYNYR